MNKDLCVVVVADFSQDRLQHEGVAVPLVQDDGPAAQLLRDASQWPVAHLVDLCCADKVNHCLRYTPVSTTALFRLYIQRGTERTCVYNHKGHVCNQKGHVFATRNGMYLQPERACVCNQKGQAFTTGNDMCLQAERTCVCNQKGHVFATRKDMCLQPERTRNC